MNKKQAIEFANRWREGSEAAYREARMIKRVTIGVFVVSYAVAYTVMSILKG